MDGNRRRPHLVYSGTVVDPQREEGAVGTCRHAHGVAARMPFVAIHVEAGASGARGHPPLFVLQHGARLLAHLRAGGERFATVERGGETHLVVDVVPRVVTPVLPRYANNAI